MSREEKADLPYRKLAREVADDRMNKGYDHWFRLWVMHSGSPVFAKMGASNGVSCDIATFYELRTSPREHFLITVTVTPVDRVKESLIEQVAVDKPVGWSPASFPPFTTQ